MEAVKQLSDGSRTFPDLEPLYNAARSYLEIGQRIDLLNARVDVRTAVLVMNRLVLTNSRCYKICSSCSKSR